MTAELHLQRIGRLSVAALFENGRTIDLAIDDHEATSPCYGAVYRATCETVRKGLGAFLQLQSGAVGFLPAGQRGVPADAGETLLVQVKQEGERANGADSGKAATVSREIALAGRFVVHLPFGKGVKRSKKFAGAPLDPVLSETLSSLPGGFVVRSSAAEIATETVIAEARALVGEAASLETRESGLRLAGPSALRRLLVDHPTRALARIAADRGSEPAARSSLRPFAPALEARLETDETIDLTPLLVALPQKQVALSNGAGLIIEPTAAFIAIDVNAGPRSDFANVNREAAAEIARQIRLRALAGQILIDFVGTERRAFREDISPVMEQHAEADPAGWQVHGFSHLGLCETTRTRRTRPTTEKLAVEPSLGP